MSWSKLQGDSKGMHFYKIDLEKAVAPHSSTLAWKIPWTEEPGRLQSLGSLRVGHDWATSLSLFTFMRWRRKWQPTPVFLPGESQGRGAWWAAVYGVAQNRTRLKWLSSSSSKMFIGHDSLVIKASQPIIIVHDSKCIKCTTCVHLGCSRNTSSDGALAQNFPQELNRNLFWGG